jgi:hypothetical protein
MLVKPYSQEGDVAVFFGFSAGQLIYGKDRRLEAI